MDVAPSPSLVWLVDDAAFRSLDWLVDVPLLQAVITIMLSAASAASDLFWCLFMAWFLLWSDMERTYEGDLRRS
ncbi:MAG: hypothetical protein WKF64_03260 [Ilumatobacteraceae bacterium]